MSVLVPRRIAASSEKAVLGPGAASMMTLAPLQGMIRNPQDMMRVAQGLFHSDPWVRRAEETIDLAFSTVDWHLEDENEEAFEAEDDSPAGRALTLLRKPQAALTDRQMMTRSQLWSLTARHMGLCGSSFWLLDQMEGLGHTPLATLYINPARMTPAEDAQGNLTGWVLDYRGSAGSGVPLELDEIAHFKLNEPDSGHFGIGIVESAMSKTLITRLSDSHAADVLQSGGRLAGIVSAKSGATIPDNVFQQLVRDFRTINEQPGAAKHVTVMQGPADFTKTAATPAELGLLKLMTQSRDDTLALWGVPLSQIGGYSPTGLNSGDVRKYDRAAMWQNAVHPRLVQFWEVLQYQIIDRYAKLGAALELEFDEPEFDDDSPRYDLLSKSSTITLTNDERRALIGKDPLPPEILGATGKPLGEEVWLPATLVVVSNPDSLPVPQGTTSPTEDALGRGEPDYGNTDATSAAGETTGKARLTGAAASMRTLRTSIERKMTPKVKSAVVSFLADQKREIAALVTEHEAAIVARKGRDTSPWWPARKAAEWDRRLAAALAGHLGGIAETVAGHVREVIPAAAKAAPVDELTPRVVERVLTRGAARVTRINETTRDTLQKVIADGVAEGLSGGGLGDLIEAATTFDEYRAELIARTELADAYNAATLGSYSEIGVEEVEAMDGDDDEECAARNGQTFSVEEAADIEDHPNGTLDWLPAGVDTGKARVPVRRIPMDKAQVTWQPPSITVPAPIVNLPAPIYEIPAPVVHVAAPEVHIDMDPFTAAIAALKADLAPRPTRKTVRRDASGRIAEVTEEQI